MLLTTARSFDVGNVAWSSDKGDWLKRGGSVELRHLGAGLNLLRQGAILFAPSKSLMKPDQRRWSSVATSVSVVRRHNHVYQRVLTTWSALC